MAKQLLRRAAHHVGLAVAAGHEETQHIVGHRRHRRLVQMQRHGKGVELDHRMVVERQHALGRVQPHKTVAVALVAEGAHLHTGRDRQPFFNNAVGRMKSRLDVEQKMRRQADLIVQQQVDSRCMHVLPQMMAGEMTLPASGRHGSLTAVCDAAVFFHHPPKTSSCRSQKQFARHARARR